MLSANTIIKDFRSNDVSKLLFYSLIVYTIWILFFQNVIYKSRHVIPIVIVLLYFLAVDKGTSFYKNRTLFTFSSFYIITLVFVSIILVNQHKSPSAISKLKDHLISMDTNDKIVCIPLVKYYLETHGINATYIDVKSIDKNKIPDTLNGAIVIGNQNGLFNDSFQVISDSSYFHNPYVNRMWSEIHTFRLSK
tara:strand:- start:16 stop:594 length:579 start_codon:yes stop_codon:yes gene_type:complete